jgi:hypothetical protein
MVPPCGMGIGCERSVSPGQPGRKIQARAGDFSVPKRVLFAAEGSRCRPSALRTDSEGRDPIPREQTNTTSRPALHVGGADVARRPPEVVSPLLT